MKLKIFLLSIISIFFLIGCDGSKEKVSYTQDEMNKIYETKTKHEQLIGTGYWRYINSIQIKRNSRDRIRFQFNMNNSYWNITDRKTRSSITDNYWNMQRAFEKQVGLNKKISISTN